MIFSRKLQKVAFVREITFARCNNGTSPRGHKKFLRHIRSLDQAGWMFGNSLIPLQKQKGEAAGLLFPRSPLPAPFAAAAAAALEEMLLKHLSSDCLCALSTKNTTTCSSIILIDDDKPRALCKTTT